MRILVAPDSFKGSLAAGDVAWNLVRGIESSAHEVSVVAHPLADGGEGTLEILFAHGYEPVAVEVRDHLGRHMIAHYARAGGAAVVESARACPYTPGASPDDSLRASSYGVGQLIAHALDHGVTEIALGVGGTASSDGGAGMLEAVGVRLLDDAGTPIPPGGAGLLSLSRIDTSHIHPRLAEVAVSVLTDVDNPLTGASGAARVFAPQKGADPVAVSTLEQGLEKLATVAATTSSQLPGSGAGGGIGFAAMAFLGATRRSGALALMDLTGFTDALHGVDLVVTGEGSFDDQSARGKVVSAVMERAAQLGVPVTVVCGVDQRSHKEGVDVVALSRYESDQDSSIRMAAALIERAGAEIGLRVSR